MQNNSIQLANNTYSFLANSSIPTLNGTDMEQTFESNSATIENALELQPIPLVSKDMHSTTFTKVYSPHIAVNTPQCTTGPSPLDTMVPHLIINHYGTKRNPFSTNTVYNNAQNLLRLYLRQYFSRYLHLKHSIPHKVLVLLPSSPVFSYCFVTLTLSQSTSVITYQ